MLRARSISPVTDTTAVRSCHVTVEIDSDNKDVNIEDYAVSLGFCMPNTEQAFREQTYQVNSVFQQNTNSYFDDQIDEEADRTNEDG